MSGESILIQLDMGDRDTGTNVGTMGQSTNIMPQLQACISCRGIQLVNLTIQRTHVISLKI